MVGNPAGGSEPFLLGVVVKEDPEAAEHTNSRATHISGSPSSRPELKRPLIHLLSMIVTFLTGHLNLDLNLNLACLNLAFAGISLYPNWAMCEKAQSMVT
jgi:hypothetical protein